MSHKRVRLEHDMIGTRKVPADAYYGIHALRGAENFPITESRMPAGLIVSLAQVKSAAASANAAIGRLTTEKAAAITAACDEIIAGKWHDHFIVDPI